MHLSNKSIYDTHRNIITHIEGQEEEGEKEKEKEEEEEEEVEVNAADEY